MNTRIQPLLFGVLTSFCGTISIISMALVFAEPGLTQEITEQASQSKSLNWPEFRGPMGNGHTNGKIVPADLGAHIKWRIPITGKGWSSPVVWGDQVWLTTATKDGKRMSGICVDINSGKIIRDLLIHENETPSFSHPTNSYASPTPVIEEGRVYLHFGSYGTTCIDTTNGTQIWQRTDFECDHYRGPASSPILYDGKLIVAYDGFDQQYVVALNKETGETVWKRDREIKYDNDNGDWRKAYSTGSVFEIADKPVLVYPSAKATIAYDPSNGEPLWTVYHDGMNSSARPQMTKSGLIVLTNGMGRMDVIKPLGTGDITKTGIVWTTKKGVAKRPSPLIVNDRIYMFNDQGVATCTNVKDGELVWQERVGGSFAASPIFDGEKIFAFNEQGKIFVVKPGDEYELIKEVEFGDGFKASPAVVADKMILRSISELFCVSADD